MKVLFLSPQPFYQERGTPIAVRIALEALSRDLSLRSSQEPQIDLLCYREGQGVTIRGVTIHRLPTPQLLDGVRPGISLKKLACDIVFAWCAFGMLWRNRKDQYGVIHAVEESVFIAWIARHIFKTPYIYDMDSSLAMQVTEKWWLLRPLLPILEFFERHAVRASVAVAPVCDALEAIAQRHGSRNTVMLRDVSLLDEAVTDSSVAECPLPVSDRVTLRTELGLGTEQPIVLYVGNLETYQGIDLLIESFALVASNPSRPHLAVVGGHPQSIEFYRGKVAAMGLSDQVTLLGARPVALLATILRDADILVSPRTKGNNTPMKIYSYLHSGRALLATDLPTHRQVLDDSIAVLTAPTTKGFSDGLALLLNDTSLRHELAERARRHAQNLYTVAAFQSQLATLYDTVHTAVTAQGASSPLAVGDKV